MPEVREALGLQEPKLLRRAGAVVAASGLMWPTYFHACCCYYDDDYYDLLIRRRRRRLLLLYCYFLESLVYSLSSCTPQHFAAIFRRYQFSMIAEAGDSADSLAVGPKLLEAGPVANHLGDLVCVVGE